MPWLAIADKALLLQGSPEGDTITVYPSKIDPHCEALMFVLSASDSDVSTMNLNTPDTLQFNGHSAGEDYAVSHFHTALSACIKPNSFVIKGYVVTAWFDCDQNWTRH